MPAELICYASAMGNGRNREAVRAAGWRVLITPQDVRDPDGMSYCLDSGAWYAFIRGLAFDEVAYEKLLERYGVGADFTVLPDIVAGGLPSLALSVRWTNRALSLTPRVLIAVQDGMTPDDLRPYVGPSVGIFLGGSTEWKLATMQMWGDFCAELDLWYHVARVNTLGRIRMAMDAGATSIDGSSASRFADSLPLLVRATMEHSMLSPRAWQ